MALPRQTPRVASPAFPDAPLFPRATLNHNAFRGSHSAAYRASEPVHRASETARRVFGSARRALETVRRASANWRRALGTARRAFGTARRAFGTARRAFGTARQAFGTARRAFGIAHRALGTARQAFGTARRALETAHRTFGTAHRAFVHTAFRSKIARFALKNALFRSKTFCGTICAARRRIDNKNLAGCYPLRDSVSLPAEPSASRPVPRSWVWLFSPRAPPPDFRCESR